MTCRQWLSANGYADVVELIAEAEKRWRAAGRNTRRNWWETLAGGIGGRPRVVYGIEFLVLAVAQIHQGLPVTENAIQRSPDEVPPPRQAHGRSLTRWREREGQS